MDDAKCVVIGLAGGSGSGKTSVAKALARDFKDKGAIVIEQDWYYRNIPEDSRIKVSDWNFDHPDSVEFSLLIDQLKSLRKGEPVDVPQYDYKTHSRMEKTRRIYPQPVIILEGILILDNPELRSLLDIKIYVDTDADVRFIRRLQRDIHERGRNVENVITQYYKTVRPMHETFVEQSKKYADIIIPQGAENYVAIDVLKTKIKWLLREAHGR
ncbi:MAG: uridine kinase [Candidatus Neomarinimicrobiota bacterium]|nr:uridine kinase [Candidatus Neomarinimicrobiota bacterium]RKY49607.1 MAG: uridine kinase [Candidatus Neomarinimicrobiota bacterium]